jgi:hypothetical protein
VNEYKDFSFAFYLIEFLALRQEIAGHSKRQTDVFVTALVLFSLMATVALTIGGKSKRLLLLYPFVAMFLTELCYDSGEAIHLIAQYIADKTESRFAGMAWEKWLTSSGVKDPIVSLRLHRNRVFFVATQLGSFAIYFIGGASAVRGGNLKDFSPSSLVLLVIGLGATARTYTLRLPVRDDARKSVHVGTLLAKLWHGPERGR